MANDLFGNLGGLGGLVKGLSGLMPQDDPNVKVFNAQNNLSELKQQETELYAEIGKQAAKASGLDSFGEIGEKLRLVQSNISAAEGQLSAVREERVQAEKAAAQAACPACGYANPEGTKFCQECGAKLAAGPAFCTNCGAENPPGTRFCGSCGGKIGE